MRGFSCDDGCGSVYDPSDHVAGGPLSTSTEEMVALVGTGVAVRLKAYVAAAPRAVDVPSAPAYLRSKIMYSIRCSSAVIGPGVHSAGKIIPGVIAASSAWKSV